MDDNFDEMRAIFAANGVALEMAMAKLLELKSEADEEMRRVELSSCPALPPGRTDGW